MCDPTKFAGAHGYFCELQAFKGKIYPYAGNAGISNSYRIDVDDTKLGVKLFKKKTHFDRALAAIELLKDIYADRFHEFTTIREVNGSYAVVIKEDTNANALSNRNRDQKSIMYGIVQEMCFGKEPIDTTQYYDNIKESLDILHNKGYVHKDIKPDNIVKCQDRYKLIDFDYLVSRSDKNLVELVGTPAYMSPQFLGYHKIILSDVMEDTNKSSDWLYKRLYNVSNAYNASNTNIRVDSLSNSADSWGPPTHDPLNSQGGGDSASSEEWNMMVANDLYALALTLVNVGMDKDSKQVNQLVEQIEAINKTSIQTTGGKRSHVKLKRTSEKIRVSGGYRVIYLGPRGARYIKYGGEMVSLATLRRKGLSITVLQSPY